MSFIWTNKLWLLALVPILVGAYLFAQLPAFSWSLEPSR
jgi:hypothetical protein